MRLTLLAAGLLCAAAAQAQQSAPAPAAAAGDTAARKWGPAPPAFPPGAQMAVISGDPGKAGPFTVEFSFPDGYRVPPHFHPTAEHVTVRSGTFLVGMGDTVDLAAAQTLTAGQEGEVGPKMHHYAAARGATVVAVRAVGPFAMTYVNPADDPRRTATP